MNLESNRTGPVVNGATTLSPYYSVSCHTNGSVGAPEEGSYDTTSSHGYCTVNIVSSWESVYRYDILSVKDLEL